MAKYHPDTRFITDFAAGSLPLSQALCVSAHLHYCAECKQKVAQLTDLGSTLFDELQPIQMRQDFSSLMTRINSLPEEDSLPNLPGRTERAEKVERVERTEKNPGKPAAQSLPAALRKITNNDLESLSWRSIGKNFRFSELSTGDSQRETSLFTIKAGGNVPRHRHKGDEITVVLKGSFSDQDDHYEAGDFIVRTKGETHTPVASQDDDCLCLYTLDAPIQMTNWFYRLLVPLLRNTRQAA